MTLLFATKHQLSLSALATIQHLLGAEAVGTGVFTITCLRIVTNSAASKAIALVWGGSEQVKRNLSNVNLSSYGMARVFNGIRPGIEPDQFWQSGRYREKTVPM